MKSTHPEPDPQSDGVETDSRLGVFDSDDDRWLSLVRGAEESTTLGHLGDYEILGACAQGGQGVVYKARRTDGRLVALKRIHGGMYAPRTAKQRLATEIETIAQTRHPNIVSARDVEVEGGELLLEMDWVDGVPVTAWAANFSPDDPDRESTLIAVFVKICRAVSHVHELGSIHRDLKPSNILVTEPGEPFVLDFGLAKPLADISGGLSKVTRSGNLLGTPEYAAPEQLDGDEEGLDERADVYSLGVLLYRVFVGRGPYTAGASLGQLLQEIQLGQPLRPRAVNSHISKSIEAVILKAMRKEPSLRYPNVASLQADLEKCASGQSVSAPRAGFLFDLKAIAKRHPTKSAIAATSFLALVVTVAVIAVYAWRLGVSQDETSRAHHAADEVTAWLVNLAVETDGSAAGRARVLALLDGAAGEIDVRFAEDEWTRARTNVVFGQMYAKLEAWEKADRHLSKALSTYRELGPRNRRDVAETLRLLALARAHLKRPGAIDLQREAIGMVEDFDDVAMRPLLVKHYISMGETLFLAAGQAGRTEAETYFDEAVQVARDVAPGMPAYQAKIMRTHAECLIRIGAPSDAVDALELAIRFLNNSRVPSTDSEYIACDELLKSAQRMIETGGAQ